MGDRFRPEYADRQGDSSLRAEESARTRVSPLRELCTKRCSGGTSSCTRSVSKELNELLVCTQQWQARIPTDEPPPKIELRGNRWKSVATGPREDPDFGKWRPLGSQTAILFQESVVGMRVLHDLTHGGMSQALQMVDEERTLGAYHSVQNQTRHLCFAERAVMFAIMTWPGSVAKYEREIERQAQRFMESCSTLGVGPRGRRKA